MKKLYNLTFILLFLFLTQSNKNMAQQWEGLTLVAVKGATTATLVDTSGVIVKTWTLSGGVNGYPAYMIPGGTIYRTISVTSSVTPQNGGMTGKIQKIGYNNNLLWEWTYNSPQGILHHDICIMPNGHLLVTAYDVKTQAEMLAAGYTGTAASMWSETIMEVEEAPGNTVNVVWQWKMWDHMVQNADPSKANYQTSIVLHPELMNINHITPSYPVDFFHMNGIDYNPVLDQITFSSHMKNEWYVIDHSTSTAEAATHSGGYSGKGGDFLYRWGNPSVYSAVGPTICNTTHDAHFVPYESPNGGFLAAINNGGQTSPSLKTTVDFVNPPRTGYNYTYTPGSAFTPTTYTSRLVSPGYSGGWSSSEQFPNGNNMVCLANAGIIYETNSVGSVLWSYNTGGLTPQAHRYRQCYVSNIAGPQPSINLVGNILNSTASGTAYQWYRSGIAIAGATNQAYTPVQSGTFVVRVYDGCFYQYSPALPLTIITAGTNDTSHDLEVLEVYPNPGNGKFEIKLKDAVDFKLEVFAVNGQLVYSDHNNTSPDLSFLQNGLYILNLSNDQFRTSKKIAIIK